MKKKLIYIIFFLIISLFVFLYLNYLEDKNINNDYSLNEIDLKKKEVTVKGNSMEPLIKDGETLIALPDYYDYYNIKRDDIVLIKYAGNENPLVKSVKAVAGDSFELKLKENNESSVEIWQIFINGELLKNSANEPYNLVGRRYDILSLYEKSYNNIIPKNSYLILGELTRGGTDSTRFGLIDKSNIIAKVLLDK